MEIGLVLTLCGLGIAFWIPAFVGMLGYTSVCIASPMAWFGACALLIPCYYRMMKVWKKDK